LKVIRDVADKLGIKLVKLDELHFAGSIVERMRSEINESDLMIAIVTEENGNVYYEIGLAHCQNIPVLLLTSDAQTLKFDLKDHRAVIYDEDAPEELFGELLKAMSAALEVDFKHPHDYFASVLGRDPETATTLGMQRALEAMHEMGPLQKPLRVTNLEVLPTGELAITVIDFMGVKARAICDRNGFIKRFNTRG
jgi:hypothetical protein